MHLAFDVSRFLCMIYGEICPLQAACEILFTHIFLVYSRLSTSDVLRLPLLQVCGIGVRKLLHTIRSRPREISLGHYGVICVGARAFVRPRVLLVLHLGN